MSLGTVLRVICPEPFQDFTELTRLAFLHRRNRSCRNIPVVHQHPQGGHNHRRFCAGLPTLATHQSCLDVPLRRFFLLRFPRSNNGCDGCRLYLCSKDAGNSASCTSLTVTSDILAGSVGEPTIEGLVLTSNPKLSGPRVLYQLYFVAFFYGTLKFTFSLSQYSNIYLGFFSNLLVFYLTNLAFLVSGWRYG